MGHLSPIRKLSLRIRAAILLPPRLAFCFIAAVTMRTVCLICTIYPFLRPWILAPAASSIARAMLFAIGVVQIRHRRITHDPDHAEEPPKAYLDRNSVPVVISNHISWLDILMLQFLYSAAYVTRAETRSTPIIGGICDALPCIYVDRDRVANGEPPAGRSTTDKLVERVLEKYTSPKSPLRPLAVFPEVQYSIF
jgi:1-acyl-sn-glycerol-3-phosphate acyltransferase